ncbi:MAG TPA: hypothetical protein PL035_02655, partial [Bacillota bacterium]|nr:hypothetical protein [Bacillota bacterium]
NDSGNEETVANVEAAIANLKAAISGIDRRNPISESILHPFKALLKNFKPGRLNQSEYSAESWSTYINTYAEAEEWNGAHPDPLNEDIGYTTANAFEELTKRFWRACYGLESDSTEDISIDVSVVDNFAARNQDEGNKAQFHALSGMRRTVALTAENASLEGLYAAIGFDPSWIPPHITAPNGKVNTGRCLAIYLNGELLFFPYRLAKYQYNLGANPTGIKLHDGDKITIAYLDQPQCSTSSGAGNETLQLERVINLFNLSSMELSGSDYKEGVPVNGEVLAAYAWGGHPLCGQQSPWGGAHIFVSAEPAESAEEVLIADTDTGIKTAADGSFSYTFYKKGWYRISAYNLEPTQDIDKMNSWIGDVGDDINRNGMTAGATALVYIGENDDPQAILENLLGELEQLYASCHDYDYSSENMAQITSFYETAREVMTREGVSPGEAKTALDEAKAQIEAVAKINHGRIISELRKELRFLPTAAQTRAGEVYSFDKERIEDVSEKYDALSEHQKSMLTVGEIEQITALREAYAAAENGANFPESPGFKLTWITDPPGVQKKPDGTPLNFGGFYSTKVYLPIEEGGGAKRIEYGVPGELIKFEGSCYSGNDYYKDEHGDFLYNPSGKRHVIDFSEEFLKEEYDGYTGERLSADRILSYFRVYFYMPRQDVSFYSTFKRNPPIPLEQERTEALGELSEAYDTYTRTEYTPEGWAQLVGCYDAGVEAIKAAADTEAITAAKESALNAMSAVEKKAADPGAADGIPGWGSGADDPFDAGAKVGEVHVSVENTTFPGGDFTGVFVNKEGYPIGENDTMMTTILRALYDDGFTWTNSSGVETFNISYLAFVKKGDKSLGEFDGDPGSGWMGTLNDWFTNYGFQEFSVRNGKLADGDRIRVMFTQNLGVDLGGTWGNSDTTLKNLSVSSGEIAPAFEGGGLSGKTYKYALVINGNRASVRITPEASNKNYLTKAFLNEKVTDNREGS